MQNFMGLSGYVWWQGVVEDRLDPLQLGRARVRILGFHSDEKTKVPTDSLPWAYPAMPLDSTPGSIPNFKEGTWVMGFFRDGESAQEPIMTHMIDAGYVTENNSFKGFNDPETNSFKPEKPAGVEPVLGEVNTSKLARGITDNTIRDDSDITRVYPYNHVSESESGHLVEFNDTPGSESISVAHRSGTYSEVDQDGDTTVKVVGNSSEIIAKDKYITIDEDMNVTVGGNVISTVTGGKTEKAGSLEINSDDEVSITSEGAVTITAPTVFINGNLAVDGIITVGDGTTVTGKHVRTGSMSVTGLPMIAHSPFMSETLNLGLPPSTFPNMLAVPPRPNAIINSASGSLTAAITAPSDALSSGASLLSENLAALRKLEKSLQDAEEELDKWTDLEAEIGSRLGALELQYGIE